tara:strand:- start:11086 stop:11400 length:315 start_codon:yes stop_codon:yes gene_type:complete
LIEDLMAEGGMSRVDAEAQAKEMMGAETRDLRLPSSEQDLIQLANASVGKWRVAVGPTGKVLLLGFDYGEIDVTARWMGIVPDQEMHAGIAIIERAALKVLGET